MHTAFQVTQAVISKAVQSFKSKLPFPGAHDKLLL